METGLVEININVTAIYNFLFKFLYNFLVYISDNDTTYLLTAIGLSPGGSNTVHI
jgi:hypothetical protein